MPLDGEGEDHVVGGAQGEGLQKLEHLQDDHVIINMPASVHFYLVEYGKCHRTILSFNLMKWIMSKLICDGQLDN